MAGSEAVLMWRARERLEEKRADETFEDFGGGAEEGDRAVRG